MKINLTGPYNHTSKRFQYWTLLPTLDFVVDRQMEDVWYSESGEKHGGVVEYSLGFLWLKFAFYLEIEINKNEK